MVARSILLRTLRCQKIPLHVSPSSICSIKTKATNKTHSGPPASTPAEKKSWLTHKVETSPAARRVFVGLTNLLGYGSPKQVAGRHALFFYERVCAVKPDEGSQFWKNGAFILFILFKKLLSVSPSCGLSNNWFKPFHIIYFSSSGHHYCTFTKPLFRLLFTTNFSILVHHHQSAHLDAHSTLACPPASARTALPTSPNRPLLHRH